ncbi:MAG TPA: zf-HC2 domain-containing protein, partial [Pyrinomonadaceae bacterium]
MKTSEHLTEEAIERYGAKRSSAAEFLAASEHAAGCEQCRGRLERAVSAGAAFNGARAQFTNTDFFDLEPEHLPYERLALYVDGQLDDVEKEIADSHLSICENCSDDLADLRSFQAIAENPATGTIPLRQTGANLSPSWRQRLPAFNFLAPAGVGLAVIAVLLLGIWFAARPVNENQIAENQPTPQNQSSPAPVIDSPHETDVNSDTNQDTNANLPVNQSNSESQPKALPESAPLLALNDNGNQIAVDSNGNLTGAENLPDSARADVRQSLKAQRVSLPKAIDVIRNSRSGVLMSGSADNGVPFALETPVGKVIRENQPLLRWRALPETEYYKVAVVDSSFQVVAESPRLATNEWKVAQPLPRGVNYSWQVTAVKADGGETVSPTSPAPQARFRVIEQSAFEEIKRLENAGIKSHLARGVIYAKAGLIDEARAEFQSLLNA